MDIYLLNIVCIVLLILGIVGTVLPVLPGLVLSMAGMLIYKYGTYADLPMFYIYVFALLTIASVVLNYTIPAKTTKKYGGTTWGSIGSVIGTIVGFFIPIPLGFLIGMFAGVLIGELLHDRNDMQKAINSTKGALIGFIYGTGFSIMVGIAMLTVVVLNMMSII